MVCLVSLFISRCFRGANYKLPAKVFLSRAPSSPLTLAAKPKSVTFTRPSWFQNQSCCKRFVDKTALYDVISFHLPQQDIVRFDVPVDNLSLM